MNLDPGMYTATVNLVGFANVSRSVNVSVGVNVDIPFSLKVATVEESITVTAETPVVESKKFGTGTTMNRDELNKIPQLA